MDDSNTPLRLDSAGVMRVGAAGVALDEIMQAYHYSRNANELKQLFPELTAAEVQAALAYSLHNPDEADLSIQEPGAYWKTHEL